MKHYIKVEFGQKIPCLTELIPVILKVLDERYKDRLLEAENKRFNIYDENPLYNSALNIASYELNVGGMRLFHKTLKLMWERKDLLALEDDKVVENYNGRTNKDYVGRYETNGIKCKCSTTISN